MNAFIKPDLAHAAELFHALSDETRLGILNMLRGGERCVCDLQDAFNAAQSRLSYHLKILKTAGLVTDRVEGRWSYYTIQTEAMDAIRELVSELSEAHNAPQFELRTKSDRQLRVPADSDRCCS